MTPEGKIKVAISRVLAEAGTYKHMAIGSPYGRITLDFDVSCQGLYAAIEAKGTPDDHPTPRQTVIMREIVAKGGCLFLIDSLDGPDMKELIQWVSSPTRKFVSTSAAAWLEKHPREQRLHD